MTLTAIRKVRNGKRGTITRFDVDPEILEGRLGYAAYIHSARHKLDKAERLEAMQRLASFQIFSAAHIAKILGVHRSMLTRLGIKVETGQTKMGGAFDPAQLDHLIAALREKNDNEAYSIQHIRLAYEGGMSTVVIARLLGVSTSHVSNMLKKARQTTDDCHLERRAPDTAGEGRVEARSEAGVLDTSASHLSGVWATDPGSWPEGHLPHPYGEDGYLVELGDTPISADHPDAYVRADHDTTGCSHRLADLAWPCTRSDFGHEGCVANGVAQGLLQQV
jgi:hypothetical protein